MILGCIYLIKKNLQFAYSKFVYLLYVSDIPEWVIVIVILPERKLYSWE